MILTQYCLAKVQYGKSEYLDDILLLTPRQWSREALVWIIV
jgi:hypothetical protein